MNKKELIDAAAVVAPGLTKAQIDASLTAVLDAIVDAVAAGDKVTLVGFGTFEPRERKAREGRNPQTGETMTIPATIVPAFAPGKPFREAVAPPRRELAAAGR